MPVTKNPKFCPWKLTSYPWQKSQKNAREKRQVAVTISDFWPWQNKKCPWQTSLFFSEILSPQLKLPFFFFFQRRVHWSFIRNPEISLFWTYEIPGDFAPGKKRPRSDLEKNLNDREKSTRETSPCSGPNCDVSGDWGGLWLRLWAASAPAPGTSSRHRHRHRCLIYFLCLLWPCSTGHIFQN